MIEKDIKNSKVKTRIIVTATMVSLVFGVLYMVCQKIGVVFSDFAGAAAPWVFYGIGLAGMLTYLSTKEKTLDYIGRIWKWEMK